GERDHHGPRRSLAQDQRSEAVGVRRAAGVRLEDQVRLVDFGEDCLDDLALPGLGEYEYLVCDQPRAVVGGAQKRTASVGERKYVLGRRGARARPEACARAAGRDDCDSSWRRHLTSSASSLARAVDSQGASMSVRPKWPYTAV